MFTSIKNNFQRQKFVKMLAFIVVGTQSAAGLAYVPEKDAKKMKESEPNFLDINDGLKDANGNVAVRALEAGIKASQEQLRNQPPDAPAAPPAEKATFAIETGVALPVILRGGVRTETYPFDKLEAPKVVNGQTVYSSFFVPATAERPNPAKSLASTVSSATRRYKGRDGRRFTIRGVDVNGTKGARIWRIEDAPKTQSASA